MKRLLPRMRTVAVHAVHRLLIARLAVERRLPARRPRVLVTACWHFPIYSQTFVQQEAYELTRAGFEVRFLYSALGRRTDLADGCAGLWRCRRRVLLDVSTGARDLEWFRARVPGRVEALLEVLAQRSGLSRAAIEAHEHVLHAFSFARAVHAWRPDYLHSYFFYERTLFAWVASYLLDIPRGVSCYADHRLHDYAFKLVPLHLSTADVIVATSDRIRGELEAIAGAPLPAIVVKPNAIDVRRFEPQAIAPQPGDPARIVCVSRIDPKKGLTFLLQAVACLRRRGLDVRLHVVGAPDAHLPGSVACFDDLRRDVDQGGLADVVRFEGQRTSAEVREFLARAAVFAAPSIELDSGDTDGIPTSLLEAMASGCPIVTTDAGSIPEAVQDGIEALVVPQRDPARLGEAIARLLADRALASRLGAGARARARREFDVNAAEAAFHGRIRAALARRRHARDAGPR